MIWARGLLAVALAGLGLSARASQADAAVQALLSRHCQRCHGPAKQEGGLRIDTLSRDLADMAAAERWGEILLRLSSGEMPPKGEPALTAADLGTLSEGISRLIDAGSAKRMAKRGPVAHYRLSREEYAHTVLDLLGVYFDPSMPGALNDDPKWHGFDRIGSVLTLSPSHVERYLKAAETVLARAFPEKPVPSKLTRQESKAPERWLMYPGLLHGGFRAAESGLYRIRVKASGLPSFKGRPPRLAIWNSGLKRTEDGIDLVAPEENPGVVEFQVMLPQGNFQLVNETPGKLDDGPTPSLTPRIVTRVKDYKPPPTGYKLFLEDGRPIFPLILVDWIECEGPITLEAEQSRRMGFFPESLNSAARNSERSEKEVGEALARFIGQAWRRPATTEEINRYLKVYALEIAAGESPRAAYMAALAGVLASKNFCYIVEGSPAAKRDTLDDWELASRLSYFLWSSMPDAGLFSAAASGKLSKPEELAGQFRRMAKDPRISRLVESFPRQWLQLHRVGQFPPDPGLYPDYDKWLERSMVLESQAYFGEMMAGNLPLAEFLNSDWTMANARIAGHYRIPPPVGKGFQKVKLESGNHRGGILTHASVLSLTSDGTRHRPVHRGVWVSEAIFGRTPPPPPPNVEPLMPTPSDKPKATIRQQLKAHSTHSVCASCHQKIDPLGFAFDNFDAIGRWRTMEEIPGGTGDNPPVDASGVLPGGKPFSGPGEFKKLLVSDIDRFAEAFIGQLATYATRRVMTIDDASAIRAVAASCRKDGYRLGDIMVALVSSELFRKR
ncbi:MAG: DUF1592 domain-containing protein [Planctomycetes bacterium]|nr:DUF1592 domain-containing protein [Planctomycetota bacterium]